MKLENDIAILPSNYRPLLTWKYVVILLFSQWMLLEISDFQEKVKLRDIFCPFSTEALKKS